MGYRCAECLVHNYLARFQNEGSEATATGATQTVPCGRVVVIRPTEGTVISRGNIRLADLRVYSQGACGKKVFDHCPIGVGNLYSNEAMSLFALIQEARKNNIAIG